MTPELFLNLKHIVTYIGTKLKLFDEAPKNGRPITGVRLSEACSWNYNYRAIG